MAIKHETPPLPPGLSQGEVKGLELRCKELGITIPEYLAALARIDIDRSILTTAKDLPRVELASSLVPEGPPIRIRNGWKLLKLRKNGTLGPLFINATQVISEGEWLRSEYFFKKGYKFRPGWHVAPNPDAPHLTTKGRVWRQVEIADYEELKRPEAQGGTWWIARWMRVVPEQSNVITIETTTHTGSAALQSRVAIESPESPGACRDLSGSG